MSDTAFKQQTPQEPLRQTRVAFLAVVERGRSISYAVVELALTLPRRAADIIVVLLQKIQCSSGQIISPTSWTGTLTHHNAIGCRLHSVGVLVLEEEDEKGLDLGGFGLYITIIAWIMVGIGALYFLLVSASTCGVAYTSDLHVCLSTRASCGAGRMLDLSLKPTVVTAQCSSQLPCA